MTGKKRQYERSVGDRLRKVRQMLNYSRQDMAAVLELKDSGYFKNETGETFPSRSTLHRLQRDYDISMDWFLFNKGPMLYKGKQQQEEKPGLEERFPEARELLDAMDQDSQLKHEILAYFFKYRNKKKSIEKKQDS